jgi:hypothetical protein
MISTNVYTANNKIHGNGNESRDFMNGNVNAQRESGEGVRERGERKKEEGKTEILKKKALFEMI